METLKLPTLKLAYDVTVLINGVIRPVYEVETLKLPTITLAQPAASQPDGARSESRKLAAVEPAAALVEQGGRD